MKAFKRKPEEILAERFDGTPESAKKIIDWMKTFEDEGVAYYHLQLKEERYLLGSEPKDAPASIGDVPELSITTAKARYFLTPGNWMTRGKSGFRTSYDDFLAKHYDEI